MKYFPAIQRTFSVQPPSSYWSFPADGATVSWKSTGLQELASQVRSVHQERVQRLSPHFVVPGQRRGLQWADSQGPALNGPRSLPG